MPSNLPRPTLFRYLSLAVLVSISCTVLYPANAREQRVAEISEDPPVFDPLKFYTGRTRSWGVMENRRGEPTQRIKTETRGKVVNGELRMEQDLEIGSQPRQHRSWKMRRLDASHFEATANDVIGVARGVATGNTFTWSFTLALKPGNPLFNVRMTQRMYLQPGGRTMINRDTITKFGLVVGHVTEQFQKL